MALDSKETTELLADLCLRHKAKAVGPEPQSCSVFKTYDEWAKYNAKRIDIISRNRSLRMQGKPLLPQPARCEPPPKRVVYSREPDASLTYEGTLREGEQVPEGLILKLEKY
jgi:hypothetical protein